MHRTFIINEREWAECDVVLWPEQKNRYVHFDVEFFHNGESVGWNYSKKNADSDGNPGLFRYANSEGSGFGPIPSFILSEDKKEFRRTEYAPVDYITASDFNWRRLVYSLPEFPEGSDVGTFYAEKLHNDFKTDLFIIKKVAVVPVGICPCCGYLSSVQYSARLSCINYNLFDYSDFIGQPTYKFSRCDKCRSKEFRDSVSNKIIHTAFCSDTHRGLPGLTRSRGDIRNPRDFLYRSKEKPPKSFFKKYVTRHLTRVRKRRPISSLEVSFFRSWLGAKDIAALAN